MIIIGEKINGAIPKTAEAILNKDEGYIRELALKQAEFGANYIDVCAGTDPSIEVETLKWLIDIVQDSVETPICIDSSDVDIILELLPYVKKPGMINSVSEEYGKCDRLMPKAADTPWKIIALTCDNNGISLDSQVKVKIGEVIMEKAKKYGIDEDRIYIDPLVTTLSTTENAIASFVETMAGIREKYPRVHFTSGLSNISFGMPFRSAVNRSFLTLAMNAGMDSAIMDPLSPDMRATLYATEALLGQDRHCRRFLNAFRKGVIGPKK
ncbi:MAG: methyltetrahydrofolate cobalamin methyltransferase [Oscillospiraceae bacterium]|nr:methyltetrahydrofolate cobalamin methyltransferase [Oscillospiraceae bacterium]